MKKKGKNFIRDLILQSRITDFYLLSQEQQTAIAVHAFDQEDDIDTLVSIAEKLPDLLLKYYTKELTADEVLTQLIIFARQDLKTHLAALFNDIHDELVIDNLLPGDKPEPYRHSLSL